MLVSRAPWFIDTVSEMCDTTIVFPPNHLLGLPQELRNIIYDQALIDIQNSSRAWNQKPYTKYDSLLLTCKQLHSETSRYLFLYRPTKASLSKILELRPDKINVGTLRALNLQVSHQADHRTFGCILTILDKFQLSIQELHLSFYGQDPSGNTLRVKGCGYLSESQGQDATLPIPGQNISRAFAVLRQIMNLRNLQILQIENLNFPVLHSVLLQNKNRLQAICCKTDARAQVPNLMKIYQKRPDLFTGMLGGVLSRPHIRVLELDANTVVPAEALIKTLSPDLQHFSWRVPNYDYQSEPETSHSSFEHTTCNTLSNLSVRAPDLKTLRLCVTRRAPNPQRPKFVWEISHINQTLTQYLSSFLSLEHLEIHDSYADRFYPDTLIETLPYGLKRLYISDRLIDVDVLVKNVRQRYFACQLDEESELDFTFDDLDLGESYGHIVGEAIYISVSKRGFVEFHRSAEFEDCPEDELIIERQLSKLDDCLSDKIMLGEARYRDDEIPLTTGKLGFVAFDYGVSADEQYRAISGNSESIQSKIFRLNGQLLDREHNLHLASTQERGQLPGVGIKPKRIRSGNKTTGRSETADYSAHPGIHQALHAMAQLKWHSHHISEIKADLESCFDESMDWYFGAENEAEDVFRFEPAAPVHGQKHKPILIEVGINPLERCQWSAPEYEMPPVGSFPAPMVPRDWRDDIRAKA